jgi:hypothetical protein
MTRKQAGSQAYLEAWGGQLQRAGNTKKTQEVAPWGRLQHCGAGMQLRQLPQYSRVGAPAGGQQQATADSSMVPAQSDANHTIVHLLRRNCTQTLPGFSKAIQCAYTVPVQHVYGKPPQWQHMLNLLFIKHHSSRMCPQALSSSCAAAAVTPLQLRQKSRVDITGQAHAHPTPHTHTHHTNTRLEMLKNNCTNCCHRHTASLMCVQKVESQQHHAHAQSDKLGPDLRDRTLAQQPQQRRPKHSVSRPRLSSVSVCHRPSPQL